MSTLDVARRAAALLDALNALRERHGGDTYSMGDIKRFARLTHGGGALHRERFLADWTAIYTEFGPRFAELGVTIQAVDDAFLSDRARNGLGPVAFRRFAEAFIARVRRGLTDDERGALANAMELLPIRPSSVAGLHVVLHDEAPPPRAA